MKQQQRGLDKAIQWHPSLTLEDAKELLGVERFSGNEREVQDLIMFTERLLERNGKHWVCKNREKILAGWEFHLMG